VTLRMVAARQAPSYNLHKIANPDVRWPVSVAVLRRPHRL